MRSQLGAWAAAAAILAAAVWATVGAQPPERMPGASASMVQPSAVVERIAPASDSADLSAGRPGLTGSSTAAGENIAPLATGNAARVSAPWAAAVSRATGIPERALLGYAGAALGLTAEMPSCRLGWNTLAALGAIESGHGTHGGSVVAADGVTRPAILGPQLDGSAYDAVADTDQGRWDQSAQWDRAVGPLQFIPSTWRRWGADGNRDGLTDPQQIDDAALAAGRYLCSYGDLSVPTTWRASIFAYNHVESYENSVAAIANEYAAQASKLTEG